MRVGLSPAAAAAYMPRMFADFLKRLTAPDPDRLPEPDAQLALAALLVRIGRSDGSYDDDEIARITASTLRFV